MDINLREEMGQLLNKYGYKVLLQRTSRKLHCRCWNPETNEAQPRCSICNGTGWVNRIESHYTRNDQGSLPISWGSRNKDTEIGRQLQGAEVLYFNHDAFPKEGDVIYIVGWDERNRPTHLVKAFNISYSHPHRANNGRIEYFQVHASNKVMDKDFHNFQVRKIGEIANYEPIIKE